MCRALEFLLSPTNFEEFRHDAWEKKAFLVQRERPEYYAGLFSLDDVDRMIAFTRPVFAEWTGSHATPSSRPTYVRGTHADHPSDAPALIPGLAELRTVFDQGKTVVTMGMHKRWPAVAELCRNLETVFHCPVHANLYLTPAGSQGFAAHYDPHEVFILQLAGVKHWRLYERTEVLPLECDNSRIPSGSLGAARELVLQPGDLLYIPRGHVHDAYTTDSFSLHLTVGINVYRWADLLYHAVEHVIRSEPRFRESIAGGALPEDPIGTKRTFNQLLELLSQRATHDESFDRASDSLAGQFFGQLAMLPGTQFSSHIVLEKIAIDTMLQRDRQAICRVTESGEDVVITFPGNRIVGPRRIGAALRFVADQERFVVRDLPGELNDQAKIILARRLAREGLVTLATADQSERAWGMHEPEQANAARDDNGLNSAPAMEIKQGSACRVPAVLANASH